MTPFLLGVFWTGGSLNPARSFGPAVVIKSFASTHWIYWVGPFAGSILAVIEFKLIKALEYTTVNGEDSTETKRPDRDLESQRVKEERLEDGRVARSPVSQATTVAPGGHDYHQHQNQNQQGYVNGERNGRTDGGAGAVAGVNGPGLGSVQNTHAALPRDADSDLRKMSGY